MEQFTTVIKNFFRSALDIDDLFFQIQSGYLRNIIESAFCLEGDISVEEKAEIICSELFFSLTGEPQFSLFLQKITDLEDKRKFLSVLLYRLYFNDLNWKRLINKSASEAYFFQLFAADGSKKSIEAIWALLSFQEKIDYLTYCAQYADEGAYHIFSLARSDQKVSRFLEVLENGFVCASDARAWIDDHIELDEADVEAFLLDVQDLVNTKTMRCHRLFPKFELEAWKKFVEVFGLYGLQMPKGWQKNLQTHHSLDEILASLNKPDFNSRPFTMALSSHLEALSHFPHRYREGLDSLVFAMPTLGKDLSRQAWLSSIVASLKKLCQFLSVPMEAYPIFVFDLSVEPLFKANGEYINELCKTDGAVIFHLDKKTILTIAKKLQIESLFITSSDGSTGFGGARNAVFLLAPILKHYYRQDFLDMPVTALKEVILRSRYVIHMGDDDVHVPISTAFSDALFTFFHRNEYFCRLGLVVGRQTVEVAGSLDLAHVLLKPEDIVLQNKWEKEPYFHGMAGLLSKSKICLNLPHGQEESSLEAMKKYYFDIRKPFIHLAGARYPAAHIPVNRFSGLAAFLRRQNGYVLQLLQASDLIDSHQLHKRCALPWNTREKVFRSLGQAALYMMRPKTEKEMEKRFWNNFEWYARGFTNDSSKEEASSVLLEHLINQNFSEIVSDFSLPRFQNEIGELVELFEEFRQDAIACKEFTLSGGKKQKEIEQFPMTYSLYLVCQSVGLGGFQKSLEGLKLVKSLPESLQSFLEALKGNDSVSVKEIFDRFAGKGAAALLIIFSLPFCFPLQIPGFSTPFGIVLAFIGIRIAFAKRLWWPKWILEKKVPASQAEKLVQKTISVVLYMQKVFRPRLTFLVFNPWLHRLHGIVIFILAVLLSLPLPIPMTNLLSAIPILFIGLGLLEDDGVAILIGYFFASVCFGAFAGLVHLLLF